MPLIVSGYVTRADGAPLEWRVVATDLASAVARARALAQEADAATTARSAVPVDGDVVITMIEEAAAEPVATVRPVASAVRPMAKGRP